MHCVHEHELHAQSAGSMHVMHAQGGLTPPTARKSERGGIPCAAHSPPRNRGGIDRGWLQEGGFIRKFMRKCSKNGLKRVRGHPEGTRRLPKSTKMHPRAPQERQERPQEGPKSVPRASQERPRGSQERPRAPQERPRGPQEGPKSNPREAKSEANSSSRGKVHFFEKPLFY